MKATRLLALLLLAGLLLRLWFLNGRWVNPDEGAHLMDGLLALQGHVPGADFGARQPFYVYVLAGCLGLFGASFEAARLYPVLASVASGALIYLITSRLFDPHTGLVAAGIYLFLPFTVVFGTHVKTQPLTILLSCAAIYAVLLALDRKSHLGLLALAGGALALAYYSRQSSLSVLLALLLVIAVAVRNRRALARAVGGLALGFAGVCAAAIALYSTVLPLPKVLSGSINPIAFVMEQLGVDVTEQMEVRQRGTAPTVRTGVEGDGADATARTGVEANGAGAAEGENGKVDQPWSVTVRNIQESLTLNAVLVLALLLSPFHLFGPGRAVSGRRYAPLLVYLWLVSVGLVYAFWAMRRGFFPAYFGELLPPLAIVTAVVALDGLSRLKRSRRPGSRDVLVLGVLGLFFFGAHLLLGPLAINRPLYYVAVPTVLALVYLEGRSAGRHAASLAGVAAAGVAVVLLAADAPAALRMALYGLLLATVLALLLAPAGLDPRRQPSRVAGFVSYSLLVSTAMLWLGTSQAEIDRTYDGVWSPEAVREVAAYLEEVTEPTAEVMSGAVIWEFQAQRRPFMLISHPLSMRPRTTPERRRQIEERMRERPPEVIILDGYTEQTYLSAVPMVGESLETEYELRRVFRGARYPVEVYTWVGAEAPSEIDDPASAPAERAEPVPAAPTSR